MNARVIRKALAGKEDLLLGRGSQVQQRNGNSYLISRVDLILPVFSQEEFDAVNFEEHSTVLFEGSFYQYDSENDEVVEAVGGGGLLGAEDIAALKELAPSLHGELAQTLGSASAGDGKSTLYYWDSLSTATDNGSTIIELTAGGAGRWIALAPNTAVTQAPGNNSTAIATTAFVATAIAAGGSGITQAAADVRYVNVTGDVMTGALSLPLRNGSSSANHSLGPAGGVGGGVYLYSGGLGFSKFNGTAHNRLGLIDSASIILGDTGITLNADGSLPFVDNSIIMGLSAGQDNVGSTGVGSILIGPSAGRNVTNGSANVAIGKSALQTVTTGDSNTALGNSAGDVMLSFANIGNALNITCIGSGSRVSGDSQVQLGNSFTTTYTYGAVQNRSDLRDKADVRDTKLGLDFINMLRPVDYKWDYRDDYVDKDTPFGQRDGSKKRSRYHHGLIAQDVKRVMDETGLDFGGFQDHSANGGNDVLSIGYEELIGPLVKAVQELTVKVEQLELEVSLKL